VPDGEAIRLVGVNDSAACEITLEVSALAMDGTLRPLMRADGDLAADALTLCTVPLSDLHPQEMLYFAWTTSTGQSGADHFAPLPYKSYDLQPAGVSLAQDGNRLTVTSTGLALFAAVEANVAGRFDKNALLLLPGQTNAITFAPAGDGATPTFTLRDLHSATYAQ
uniref:glycoside hydrolase family 2 protein n=1 Tax=Yoonia sp. TaxID=2212373 RepID=UPI002FDB9116